MNISIRIKTIKLKKHLGFPLTNKINKETGVKDFINEMENEITYIDKAGLEDLIAFHEERVTKTQSTKSGVETLSRKNP